MIPYQHYTSYTVPSHTTPHRTIPCPNCNNTTPRGSINDTSRAFTTFGVPSRGSQNLSTAGLTLDPVQSGRLPPSMCLSLAVTTVGQQGWPWAQFNARVHRPRCALHSEQYHSWAGPRPSSISNPLNVGIRARGIGGGVQQLEPCVFLVSSTLTSIDLLHVQFVVFNSRGKQK